MIDSCDPDGENSRMGLLLSSRAAALALAMAALLGLASQAEAVTAYGLTNTNGLVTFDTATPQNINFAINQISGLSPNDDLIGIDFRPADGLLYGVATGSGPGNSARIYTIDPITGVATLRSTLSASLNGSRFGFDFNPVADRLRIVSNADQNLRVDVTTGVTTTDTSLSYQPGDLFFGQNPNVISSAYTNSFVGASTTQLYGIDSVRNSLVLQVSPNGGTLQTIGLLGVDVSQLSGFDIYFDPATQKNIGFATLQNIAEGVSRFYTIDLTTGQATAVGLEMGDLIDGLAIVPAAVPEPATVGLLGLGAVLGGVKLLRRRTSARS